MGTVPSSIVEVTKDFPTGFNPNNTYIIGGKITRKQNNTLMYYDDDGYMGNFYINFSGKLTFAPTQNGVTYCAGQGVYVLITKIYGT